MGALKRNRNVSQTYPNVIESPVEDPMAKRAPTRGLRQDPAILETLRRAFLAPLDFATLLNETYPNVWSQSKNCKKLTSNVIQT